MTQANAAGHAARRLSKPHGSSKCVHVAAHALNLRDQCSAGHEAKRETVGSVHEVNAALGVAREMSADSDDEVAEGILSHVSRWPTVDRLRNVEIH